MIAVTAGHASSSAVELRGRRGLDRRAFADLDGLGVDVAVEVGAQELERRAVELHQPARRSAVAMIASDCAAELVDRAVAVLAHAEVDLRDRVAPEALDDVDEQPELDAPTFDERQHFERVAPRRVLAAERLHDVGELAGTAARAAGGRRAR